MCESGMCLCGVYTVEFVSEVCVVSEECVKGVSTGYCVLCVSELFSLWNVCVECVCCMVNHVSLPLSLLASTPWPKPGGLMGSVWWVGWAAGLCPAGGQAPGIVCVSVCVH